MICGEFESSIGGFLLESDKDLGVLGEIGSCFDPLNLDIDSVSDIGDIVDDDIPEVFIQKKKRRKEYYSETKHKKFRALVPVHMPLVENLREVGRTTELDIKTKDSFIRGNIKGGERKYNFILAVAFGMAGDFSHLLNFDIKVDLPIVIDMLKKMTYDYTVYEGDGYKDIIVRRKALNDIFATITNNEPTHEGVHSKIITRAVCGRGAIKCKDNNGVTQCNIRALFTFLAAYKDRYGIKYMIDKDGLEEFFQFRIGVPT